MNGFLVYLCVYINACYMSASSDIKILKSDYVFLRKGVNIQHVPESRSMVWYRDGYTKLRLKFLNTMYEDYGESLEFSLTIRIAKTSDSTNSIFENTLIVFTKSSLYTSS